MINMAPEGGDIRTIGMDGLDLRIELLSNNLSVRGALATLIGELRQHDLTEDDLGSVELVMAEVLNNVVEHAYGMRDGGQIEIRGRKGDTWLRFDVLDDGESMPDLQVPASHEADLTVPVDDLPEGGFGWFLIRQMTDELTYQRKDGRNFLQLKLPLS